MITNPEKIPEMRRKLHRAICSCKGDIDNCEAAKITAPPPEEEGAEHGLRALP